MLVYQQSGTTFTRFQSSAHLRQQESTIFWPFRLDNAGMLSYLKMYLQREGTAQAATGSNERLRCRSAIGHYTLGSESNGGDLQISV